LIRADDLEAQVIDWLSAWPLPAFLHLDEPDRDPSDGAHQEPAKVRAQLERQLARLARLFQWGDLSATAYRRQRAALLRQIAPLQYEPQEKRRTTSAIRGKNTLGTVLKTLSARERQGLYRRLLATVVVRQGRVIDVQSQSDKAEGSFPATRER
jgi:hypothetical protein